MRTVHLFALALVLLSLTGCPSTTTPGVDAASADSAARDASALDAPTVDTGAEVDAATVDAATVDSATLDDAARADAGAADSGPASFTVAILEPYGYGNCFPAPPDPLFLGWNVRITGPAGDVITLSQATLYVAVPSASYTEDQIVTVSVPSFPIPAGGTIDQEQRKVTGAPVVPVCSYCDVSVEGTLMVTYTSSGGGSVTVTTPLPGGIGCVF